MILIILSITYFLFSLFSCVSPLKYKVPDQVIQYNDCEIRDITSSFTDIYGYFLSPRALFALELSETGLHFGAAISNCCKTGHPYQVQGISVGSLPLTLLQLEYSTLNSQRTGEWMCMAHVVILYLSPCHFCGVCLSYPLLKHLFAHLKMS